MPQFRAEAVRCESHRLDAIEPHRAEIASLVGKQQRLLANEQTMLRRCRSVPRFELIEQVGRECPGVGTGGGRQSKTFEFAQARSGGAFRHVNGFGIVRVDASARAGHMGDMPVDRPDGPLRLTRHGHDVARTEIRGGPRVERDVERVARRRLDDGVQPSLELVGQTFARDTPGHDAGGPGDARLEIRYRAGSPRTAA